VHAQNVPSRFRINPSFSFFLPSKIFHLSRQVEATEFIYRKKKHFFIHFARIPKKKGRIRPLWQTTNFFLGLFKSYKIIFNINAPLGGFSNF